MSFQSFGCRLNFSLRFKEKVIFTDFIIRSLLHIFQINNTSITRFMKVHDMKLFIL